ncbi:MAG: hypothetical protein WCB68_13310 [Pyrinomonadaceae bacterium]
MSSRLAAIVNLKNLFRMGALITIVFALAAAASALSGAHTQTISVTITNNSALEIRHVFLSPTDQDNWGPDQLDGATISSGSSYTLNSVSCDGAGVKVITEDQNGCFLTHTASCEGNDSWTITNATPPDCGN